MLDHQYIKKLAADAGFDLCGLAPCRHLVENESMLRAWLGKGYQSSLAYMERNVEKRADPRKLVEGARTAVVCAVSYKNRAGEGYPPGHRTKVASYACAADYHTTIKGMLGRMLDALCASRPDLSGRAFVDTAPLLEKQLAVEAGLGWIHPVSAPMSCWANCCSRTMPTPTTRLSKGRAADAATIASKAARRALSSPRR